MEELTRKIEEHKEALNRVMRPELDQAKSTIRFGHKQWLKKTMVFILWILTGISAIMLLTAALSPVEKGTSTLIVVLSMFAVICLMLIRVFSFECIIDIAEEKFEFNGKLRKNRTFTMADYEGAVTRRTIKDFPEEFWVQFKTAQGTRSYKLADLNKDLARNIEPNYEAVTALWDTIIAQMRMHDNN